MFEKKTSNQFIGKTIVVPQLSLNNITEKYLLLLLV